MSRHSRGGSSGPDGEGKPGADIARATQEIADALEATIAAAPSQWYSFKPMWPDSVEEAAELEARAVRMLGSGDAGSGAVGASGAPVAGVAGASDAAAGVAGA